MVRFVWHMTFSNHLRKYATKLQAIKMAHNVYEGANTDATRPPLMIMHGLLGSKQNWRAVCRALQTKTNRKIINVDARNHGNSQHTEDHNYMLMAADVLYLAQQLNAKKISVMGHSTGGRVMMYMALKHPELVESGIIVDVSPITLPKDFFTVEHILMAMRDFKIPPELSKADGRKYAENYIEKAVKSKATINFILLNLKKNPDGSFSWSVNVDTLYKSLKFCNVFVEQIVGLAPYKGRMLFICGKKSNFVDPHSWPQIQKIFPNSEVHWLDAGHLIQLDQPVKFVDLLVKFLE